MSKIGKRPLPILEGVTVTIEEDKVVVQGSKGLIEVPRLSGIDVQQKENELNFVPQNDRGQTKMNWGTMRSLVNNAMEGVNEGFSKTLEINGVGFRADVSDKTLNLKVGFSHIVEFPIPEGIDVVVEKNKITVSGIVKELVGQVAADIRKVKKPEPYLGKGIKYEDEIIRRKTGKKAAGTTA